MLAIVLATKPILSEEESIRESKIVGDRSESEVYNCIKPKIAIGGTCRSEIRLCYINADCSF